MNFINAASVRVLRRFSSAATAALHGRIRPSRRTARAACVLASGPSMCAPAPRLDPHAIIAKIEMVEPMGSDALAWCRLANGSSMSVRQPADNNLQPGDELPLPYRPTSSPFSMPKPAIAFNCFCKEHRVKPADRLSFQLYSARFLEPLDKQFQLLSSLGYRWWSPMAASSTMWKGLSGSWAIWMTAPTAHVGLDRIPRRRESDGGAVQISRHRNNFCASAANGRA